MGEVTWTVEVQRWLEDIFEYIAAESPSAATGVVAGIYDRSQVPAEFPEIGYRYESSSQEVRNLLYGHYRIAYFVKDSGGVDILGVFHGALDINRYLL